MSWQNELEELRRREGLAREMGGPDKVRRQHDGGRLTVRERIDKLVDAGSFHEVGALAGRAEYDAAGELVSFTPANCVFGRGKIDGRPVVVVGDDFTVRGGSADATIRDKPLMAEEMAHDFRLPIIRIIEGSGGGGSVKTIETKGRANLPGGIGGSLGFHYATANLAVVPVVALGLGSVAGLGRGAAGGQPLFGDDQDLGDVRRRPAGGETARPGSDQAGTRRLGDPDPLRRGRSRGRHRGGGVRRGAAVPVLSAVLGLHAVAPMLPSDDDPRRRDESLMQAIPRDRRQVYKMRPIIEAVVDRGSFFEMGKMFGRPIITGLARIDGLPVAVMASDPYFYAGAWTAESLPEGGALRRSRRNLPSAGGLSDGLPGLHDRA